MGKVFEFPYRTVVEISLSAVVKNLSTLRSACRKEIIPVIKADAYGHGMIPIAKVLLSRGSCHMLAVATLQEAIDLRQHFNRPFSILVLSGFLPHQLEAYINHNLTPMIGSLGHLKSLVGSSDIPGIHLKIDTGMGRLGLRAEEMDEAVSVLQKFPEKLCGLATHFAESEDLLSTFIEDQLSRFDYWARRLKERKILNTDARVHAGNSAAALRNKGGFGTSIRTGISMYGVSPNEHLSRSSELTPVLQWKTRIIAVKELLKGDTVGYNRSYTASENEKIAILPVGYADGYPRSLSNRAEVLIQGKRQKVRGIVSMDMIAVDCTGLDVREGEQVILIGQEGDGSISVNELALMAGTISYEILCGISQRVPRIYFDTEST